MRTPNEVTFENHGNKPQRGTIGEMITFLTCKKRYWLIPILIPLLLIGVLIVLGGTAAAPFIYTLF